MEFTSEGCFEYSIAPKALKQCLTHRESSTNLIYYYYYPKLKSNKLNWYATEPKSEALGCLIPILKLFLL